MPLKTIEVPEIWVLSKWAIGDIRLENTERDARQTYIIRENGDVVDAVNGFPVNLGKLFRQLLLNERSVDIRINHPDECE